MKKLFKRDYKNVGGRMKPFENNALNVWAGVNTDTSEVCLEDIREFDDELEELVDSWGWMEFRLVPTGTVTNKGDAK